jgi:hypothetical protein
MILLNFLFLILVKHNSTDYMGAGLYTQNEYYVFTTVKLINSVFCTDV